MSAVTDAAAHLSLDALETGAPFVLVADEDNNRVVFQLDWHGDVRTLGYINFPATETENYTVVPEGGDESDVLEVSSYEEGAGVLAFAVLLTIL